jgi:hypothetical protein
MLSKVRFRLIAKPAARFRPRSRMKDARARSAMRRWRVEPEPAHNSPPTPARARRPAPTISPTLTTSATPPSHRRGASASSRLLKIFSASRSGRNNSVAFADDLETESPGFVDRASSPKALRQPNNPAERRQSHTELFLEALFDERGRLKTAKGKGSTNDERRLADCFVIHP